MSKVVLKTLEELTQEYMDSVSITTVSKNELRSIIGSLEENEMLIIEMGE